MALAERTAEVEWKGTLARGEGMMRAGSGSVTDLPISWASRSDRADGKSSPEELLAGAHASCYALALALFLTRDGTPPDSIDVKAKCSLEEMGDWYTVKSMDLEVRGAVPELDAAGFEKAAREADVHCPISNALRDTVEIRLSAELTG
ncbi:MAG: OsmC family peroxiredoxin [Solirubrobacterales bacterium]|jgi:osmotically inducible protein OsmC|nr:OsmC family peroxiredoxin [Solirubrobacterales bacterium]